MDKLWYKQPAREWCEALPLGNGRIGAMVYGGVEEEHLQLNEESIWSGCPIDRNNPDCKDNLAKIRKLIFAGEIEKAEQLATYAMSGTPQSQRCYQTLGDIYLQFDYPESKSGETNYSDYIRNLDLRDASTNISYYVNGSRYERKTFISYPDQGLIMHLTVDGEATLHFSCRMDRWRHLDRAWKEDAQTIAYNGNTGEGGIAFTGMLRAVSDSGTIRTIGEHLIVEGAKEVTLYFTVSTSFWSKEPEQTCKMQLENISCKSAATLYQKHVNDYQKLYDRVKLSFSPQESEEHGDIHSNVSEEYNNIPTDERLERIRNGNTDPDLVALYFQYGRYLLISSSRQGGLPANLQGIWNNEFVPTWDSKYTININTQMNYWHALSGNLSECCEPFFKLLERMKVNGQVTASKMYGCRGFVAHHNTDIYADTAPQDIYIPATYWVMGGAWMSLHIWEYYLYTRDLAFLQRNYDTLYQAVLFFQDFLMEDENGNMLTCPSVSPENTYILPNGKKGRLSAGVSMDNQILYSLFHAYLSAARLVDSDNPFSMDVERLLEKLPKPQIGKYGQLMEWMQDYEEEEPGHRHISQLFAVFPGSQITTDDTPKLSQAAKATLKRRLQFGGGHTGWSRAWIINLWARFGKSEEVYQNIMDLLKQSTFDNLMDCHPLGDGSVFQIDGNCGGASGIIEMLLQSHNQKIRLLPALPKEFSCGYAKGLRIRGNATVDLFWENGKLNHADIYPESDFDAWICYDGKQTLYSFQGGKQIVYTPDC
jgi:alpha-L-fucosidase 2